MRAYRKSVWTLLALGMVLGIESAWILQHVLRERSTEAPSRVGSLPSPAEGSLKVVFAFQVQVFENGRFLGTSDGNPITLSPGMHQLVLVSDSPQYRSEHRAFIRSGHTTTLAPRW